MNIILHKKEKGMHEKRKDRKKRNIRKRAISVADLA